MLAARLAQLDAALLGDDELASELGCAVADDWARFPEALLPTRDALTASPNGIRWGTRLFLSGEPRTLVGWGGFKGPPSGGSVELGYAIAPDWEGRGLATAATRAMLAEAFAEPQVDTAIAHTLAEPGPSARVLEKAGFTREAEVADPDAGPAWRFRITRAAWSG